MRYQSLIILAVAAFTISLIVSSDHVDALQATNSFARILINNGLAFDARNYNDYINFIPGSGITISETGTNGITIATSGGPSTDTNTAQISNAGNGEGLFGSRLNATHNTIKSLRSGQGITLSSNSTDVIIATNSKIDTITCSAGQHLFSFNNSTGDFTCTADASGSSGFTKINNVGSGTLKLVQSNSSNTANIKSIKTTFGIALTNGTDTADISTNFKVNTKAAAGHQFLTSFDNATTSGNFGTTTFAVDNLPTINTDQFVSALNNSTGDWSLKTFSVNSVTCGASEFVSVIDNSTGFVTCSTVSGLPVSLAGNLTTTSTAAFTTVFTIPLTANSGNSITGSLVSASNTAGAAVQAGASVSNANSRGYCYIVTPTTATAEVIDNLVMSTTTAETGETTWLPAVNVPQGIRFNCAINTGATPGNLLIQFQAEVASTVTVKAGSYYIKTP